MLLKQLMDGTILKLIIGEPFFTIYTLVMLGLPKQQVLREEAENQSLRPGELF